ncbi:unnamed protein product [Adineta ricciae]|uniref:Uncharacterized protein n=1 Tax=Adineta ricciae TaxID=249248 RepID=A0A815T5I4_ADIRI|nr:unnamed protein product [Adineta ricciae]
MTIELQVCCYCNCLNCLLAASFNQPNLPSNAIWAHRGITFADRSIVGGNSRALFVDTNNTIYLVNTVNNTILLYDGYNLTPKNVIPEVLLGCSSLFVTSNGDIYANMNIYAHRSGRDLYLVKKWISKTNSFEVVMNTSEECFDLFMDINDTLYCSILLKHQVVKKDSSYSSFVPILVAGTGNEGSASDELNKPHGIFVDINLDLYVADCSNHRIQLFRFGKKNAVTRVGQESQKPTISLKSPSGIALDANKYLFIVDRGNDRVVGEGPNGFRCLIGCNAYGYDTQYTQLRDLYTMSFDVFGNILVVNNYNDHIQKFVLTKIPSGLPLNEPQLCHSASWNRRGIILTNQSTIKPTTQNIFITTNNTIYVTHSEEKKVLIWNDNDPTLTKSISGDIRNPRSLFVTSNGGIYIGNDRTDPVVKRWTSKKNTFETVMNASHACYGLFIDITDTLYCSIFHEHQVVKKDLSDASFIHIPVAGTGNKGSAFDELYEPRGIFVDVNLDLYVADCGNHRVQLFRFGKKDAVTVAGSMSDELTVSLRNPIGIALDVNKYLFILDSGLDRIIGEGPYGFRCVIGCYESSSSDQFISPMAMSFDLFGNMIIIDANKNRIKKFLLENLCGELREDLTFLKQKKAICW